MDYKDYYKILGVSRNASEAEIKKKYRKLARELHPDVNPDKNAEDRFKEINEAYSVLGTQENRTKYDQLGDNWRQWQRAGRDPGGFDWSQWATSGRGGRGVQVDINDIFGGSQFSDFFNSLFGSMNVQTGARSPFRQMRGRDLEQAIEITLEEAFRGTTRTLVRNGSRIEANIPPGVGTGSLVRLSGQGEPGVRGGPPGSLLLRIGVLPHRIYARKGDDLHLDHHLEMTIAVLGGKVRIKSIDGTFELTIPPETQGGQVFRLRGKGMPRLKSPAERGDLYVRVFIQVPKNLSAKQKKLFQDIKDLFKEKS
ncbi:MAG: J domain-containing protein [Chloroflexota bacterium]